MSTTTFLSNDALWDTVSTRVKHARHVDAAVAYFGRGGVHLLPLSRGHRLIVDLSLPTVRAGGTNPREIEKLIRRGVRVFTRGNLHAKVVVADNSLIASSANVSKQSHDLLDEAGILTSDPVAVRRAREFIDRLCTEPVRPKYLRTCKRAYRPPRFVGRAGGAKPGQRRAQHAKLWLVSLRESFVPDPEVDRYEKGERRAEKLMKDPERSKTDSFHWSHKPRMADELEVGDWIIQSMAREDRTVIVLPPAQLLLIDNYVRDRKERKERWVFHLEIPERGEPMSWRGFRKATRSILKGAALKAPRTKAVRDPQVADGLLGLWTPGGRVARAQRRRTRTSDGG